MNLNKDKINDQYIINLFFGDKDYVNPNYLKQSWLAKHPKIEEYLSLRYTDSLSIKETLYRIYMNIEVRPVCSVCGNPVLFDAGHRHNPERNGWPYARTCSPKCMANDPITKDRHIQTSLEKYGTVNPAQSKVIQNKIKQTNLERYGVENVFSSDKIKEKIKETNLERYGVEYNVQNPEIRRKMQETNIKRYGTKTFGESDIAKSRQHIYTEKMKKTNLDRYGVESPMTLQKVKKLRENTCLEKYGAKTFCESEIAKANQELYNQKQRETNLEKFGVEYVFTADEIKKKIRDTNIRKYGAKTFPESEIAKINRDLYIEKGKQTTKERYGEEHYTRTQEYKKYMSDHKEEIEAKRYETKKKNKSFSISKKEEILYELLSAEYPDIIRQHKSDMYPYSCDFYIPSLDLYIEYQGTWTHGPHPYNKVWDKKLFESMKSKAETSEFYKCAIEVWSESDPKKRGTAKQNKLNYLEIYPKYPLEDVSNYIKKEFTKETNDKQIVIGI